MLAKLPFLFKQSAWLLALLIMPAHAQDEPYDFVLTDDGTGYIMKPRYDVTYEHEVLYVPVVRESDGIPIVGVDGFSYYTNLLGIQFEEGSQVKYIGSFQGCTGIEFIADIIRLDHNISFTWKNSIRSKCNSYTFSIFRIAILF